MTFTSRSHLALALIVFTLAPLGCSKSDDGDEVKEKPKVAFDGKPDPRFVGRWTAADGTSHYDLKANGSFDYDGVAKTPGGEIKNKFSANWCVKDSDILFTDRDKNVTPYAFKLEGDKMTMTSKGSLKLVTVLTRDKN